MTALAHDARDRPSSRRSSGVRSVADGSVCPPLPPRCPDGDREPSLPGGRHAVPHAFWLTCPILVKRASQLEGGDGWPRSTTTDSRMNIRCALA